MAKLMGLIMELDNKEERGLLRDSEAFPRQNLKEKFLSKGAGKI